MKSTSRKPVDLVLTIVFALLGGFRLYQFAGDGDLADLLSGIGLLLVGFSSYHSAFLMSSRGAAPGNRVGATARYVGYAGLVLILAAIAVRLLP